MAAHDGGRRTPLLRERATFQDERGALVARVSRSTLCMTRVRGPKWRRSRRRRARASHASKRRTLMSWKRYAHGFEFLSCLDGAHATMLCLANEKGHEVALRNPEGEGKFGSRDVLYNRCSGIRSKNFETNIFCSHNLSALFIHSQRAYASFPSLTTSFLRVLLCIP